MTAKLVRDGRVVRTIENAAPAETYVVPVPWPPPEVHGFPRALPVEVLLDRYNRKYDHYFPEVDVSRDVYRLRRRDGDVLIFEYETTETRKMRAR